MTRYQVLDLLCDSVNPALFLATVAWLVIGLVSGNYKKAGVIATYLAFALALVYGIMYADNRLQIWAAAGGDYSTHTAFAIGVTTALTLCIGRPVLLGSVVAVYMLLMIYQQYHTALDIVSTAVIIGLGILPAYLAAKHLLGGADERPAAMDNG